MEKKINSPEETATYASIGVLLTSIVILFISSIRNYWTIEEVPFCFVVLTCLLGFVVLINSSNRISFTVIDFIVILYIFYVLLSSFFLSFPSDRIYTLSGYLIYYVVFRLTLTKGINYIYYMLGIVLLVLLESFLGILQYSKIAENQNPFFWISGTFTNPGIFGGFVATGLPICAFFISYFKNRKWIVFSFCLSTVILLLGLILSGSRTAMISAVIGTGIFLISSAKNKPFKISVGKKAILIFAIILISGPFFYLVVQYNPASIMGRFFIWKISWNMFLDHPVFGLGHGKFAVQYGNYQALYFSTNKASERIIQLADMNYLAFNELIRILVENGVVGLSMFIFLILRIFYTAFKSIKQNQAEVLLFISILIVIMAFALFSYPFDNIPISLLFYTSVAIISSYSERQFSVLFKFRLNRMSKIVPVLVFLFFTFKSAQKIAALESWQKAQHQLLYSERSSWSRYKQAYATLSNNATFMHNYGAELTENGDYIKALDMLNQAKEYGNSVGVHTYIARCYFAIKKYNQAEVAFTKATNMNPKLFRPLNNLFQFYVSTRQYDKAGRTAKAICEKSVKIPSDEITQIKHHARLYIQSQQNIN